jgi:aminoglycoside phosphotransferase (APT) family kinase protein
MRGVDPIGSIHTVAQLNGATVVALLAEVGISVETADVEIERRDWRWIVRAWNRTLIVPSDDCGAARLLRERQLLATLAPRLSFAIPVPLGAIEGPLDLRTRIEGDTGMHRHWATLEDPVRADAYADDIARVFIELHTALKPEEARRLVGPPLADSYPLPASELRLIVPTLPAEIQDRVVAALDCYAAESADEADVVLVHGDIGTHNFVFDVSTGRVVGVIDFEEASLRDRHYDLKYLPSYGPEVMTRVLDQYRARTGAAISVGRIRLLHLATALSFWHWRERDPVDHDARSGRTRDQALAWVGLATFALDRPGRSS